MAYATYEQLKSLFGEERLLSASPGEDLAAIQERWELLLSATSAKINRSFGKQGYILPLDFTDHEAEADELATMNITLALEAGGLAMAQTPEGVATAADLVRSELSAIAAGTRAMPFAMGTTIFAGIARPEFGPDDPRAPFDDRFWHAAFG